MRYTLYAQSTPFDFAGDPKLSHASRFPLVPSLPSDYVQSGVGPGRFPYQATLDGFAPGVKQYLVIRASDDSPAANEEANTVTATAMP